MIKVGIIGVGYWGPNLVRNFDSLSDCKVTAICDMNPQNLANIQDRYPHVEGFSDAETMLDSGIDAVVIATPTATHFGLAQMALEKGIHCFVEKPLTQTSEQSEKLIALAEMDGLTLFVGHIFLHTAAVLKLRQLVASGELGDINYLSCKRLNLGPVRQDVSALFDLATHDISIVLYLLGRQPYQVSCTGLAHLNPEIHDVCNLTMHFDDNKMGMVHVSWLDPRKERTITVVGDKKMAVYDDLNPEKIKVYDQGVSREQSTTSSGEFAEFQLAYRHGGSYSPWLQEKEPLKSECSEFIRCIVEGATPKTDGHNGLQVVKVLEAAHASLLNGGKPETITAEIFA